MPTKAELIARREAVAGLYLQGRNLGQISERLSLRRDMVRRDLNAMLREWATDRPIDRVQLLEQELQKIDRVEREAWEAWERSKKEAAVTRVSSNKRARKAEKTIREQGGDPRYLAIVRDCIARRCQLLGIADTKTEISPPIPVCEIIVQTSKDAKRIMNFEQFEKSLLVAKKTA